MLTTYYYQGSDTLPYKEISIKYPNAYNEYDSTTDFYTYNSTGLLVRDSGYYVDHSSGLFAVNANQTYQYSGTTVTGMSNDQITDMSGTYTEIDVDTAQTDQNGNVIHNIKRTQSGMIESTITWDNKPPPFARLNIFHASFIFPFGETYFYELPGKNNRLHVTETYDGSPGFDEDFTGKYTYNTAGYPIQILQTALTYPGPHTKVVFVYQAL